MKVAKNAVRAASAAGLFYPAEKRILSRDISVMLENAQVVEVSEPVLGLIVPFAGIGLSGGVAAHAYRQVLAQNVEVVVLLGVNHHKGDFHTIYPGRAFATPLGDIPVHKHLAYKLAELDPAIRLSDEGYHLGEHVLEVQLPFLQSLHHPVEILPVMMGNESPESIGVLGGHLIQALSGRTSLIIAACELSKGHPDNRARLLDTTTLQYLEAYDTDGLLEGIAAHNCQISGYGPVVVAMEVCQFYGALNCRILSYRHSGELTNSRDSVTGFCAGILY